MFNFDVNALAEQIQPAIQAVAASLNTTAENLWSIGLQAMLTKGIFFLIVATICLLVFVSSSISFVKGVKIDEEAYIMLGLVFGVISGVFFLTFLYFGILDVIAPQYMLIKEILEAVKQI